MALALTTFLLFATLLCSSVQVSSLSRSEKHCADVRNCKRFEDDSLNEPTFRSGFGTPKTYKKWDACAKKEFNISLVTKNDSAFFKTTSDSNELLGYVGLVDKKILGMELLDDALEHLNAYRLDADEIQQLFEFVRDWRGLPNGDREGGESKRRLTWLYKYDSCWIRAEVACILASKVLQPLHQRSLHKLWVFGSLAVETPFAEGGLVEWQYHVAVLVRSTTGEYSIIDPALDEDGPLPVKQWLAKCQSAGRQDCTIGFQISNRFTYDLDAQPWLDSTESVFDETNVLGSISKTSKFVNELYSYLDMEWNNLEDLGEDPVKLLL